MGGDFRYLAAEGQVGASAVSVAVMVNKQRSWVYVVEGEAMQTGQAGVSADELAAELAASGVVRLDGIYFDTGKATIKPISAKLLAEVGEAIRDSNLSRVTVEGHTDDVGDEPGMTTPIRRSGSPAVRGHRPVPCLPRRLAHPLPAPTRCRRRTLPSPARHGVDARCHGHRGAATGPV